jgi:predicted XRE-type DNA-binding protein
VPLDEDSVDGLGAYARELGRDIDQAQELIRRLARERIRVIRLLDAVGLSQTAIAELVGITHQRVSQLLTRSFRED